GAAGIRIVGLREARRELLAALRAGTSVGLVGDRDLTGGGTLTELFGAPAQLPLGPASGTTWAGLTRWRSPRAARDASGSPGRCRPSPARSSGSSPTPPSSGGP